MKKRVLCIFLSVCVLISIFTQVAFADISVLYAQEQTAVRQVQTLIDALPEVSDITDENRETVENQLDAIDEAKLKLSQEQLDTIDFTHYNAVIAVLEGNNSMQPQTTGWVYEEKFLIEYTGTDSGQYTDNFKSVINYVKKFSGESIVYMPKKYWSEDGAEPVEMQISGNYTMSKSNVIISLWSIFYGWRLTNVEFTGKLKVPSGATVKIRGYNSETSVCKFKEIEIETGGRLILESVTAEGKINITGAGGILKVMDSAVFDGSIYNHGIINNESDNTGKIKGLVDNSGGWICRGNFDATVLNSKNVTNGLIMDGVFNGDVINSVESIIQNGVFNGKVYNGSNAVIENGTFTGTVDNADSGIVKDGDFSAAEKIKVYTVTFKADEASGKVPAAQYRANWPVTEPTETPERSDGYLFKWWYRSDDTTKSEFTDFSQNVTSDMTLKAAWSELFSGMTNFITYDMKYQGRTMHATVAVYNRIDSQNIKVLRENVDYTLSGDVYATNVGTYKIVVNGIGDYAGSSVDLYWKIKPAAITATYLLSKTDEFTYDGELKKPMWDLNYYYINTNSKLVENTDYTVSGVTESTEAGEYEVTITGMGNYTGSQTLKWKINKAELPSSEYTVPSNLNATYGEYLETDVELPENWYWNYTFSTTENENINLTSVGNVGTNTFNAIYIHDSQNYKSVEKTLSVKVGKATPEVTQWPTVKGVLYVNDTLTDSMLNGGTASTGGTFSVIGTSKWNSDGNKTTQITFIPDDLSNYENVVKSDFAVTVCKRNAILVVRQTNITDKYYGTSQENLGLPATVTLMADGKSFSVPITWSGYDSTNLKRQKLVGTLDLTLFANEVQQPVGEEVTAEIFVELIPLATSVSYQDKSAVYNGSPISHEVGAVTGVSSVKYQYVGIDNTVYEKSENAPTNVGTYNVTATFTMENGYSQLDPQTVKLTITPKQIIPNVILADGKHIYNKNPQKPAVTVKDGNTVIKSSEYTVNYINNINVGNATVTVTNAENGNYVFAPVSKNFSIYKATPIPKNVTATIPENFVDIEKINITCDKDNLPDGKFTVDAGQTLKWGDNTVKWTFTPNDTANFEKATGTVKVKVVDTISPEVTVILGENKWKKLINGITFGLFFKETQTVEITAEDTISNVDKVYYYLSTEEVSNDDLENLNWVEYTDKISIAPQQDYIVYAKAIDKAGNAPAYACSKYIIAIDSEKPVISGVKNAETYYGNTTFSVTDRHLDTVIVDNAAVKLTDGKYTVIADGKEHTVTATDKSGNSTDTVKFKVITIDSLDDTIENITKDNVKSSDKTEIQEVLDFVNGLINGEKEFTSDEKSELEEIRRNASELIDKISQVSTDISDLTNSVNGYDINKITSDDKSDLNGLLEKIDKLLSGDNLNEVEKIQLTDIKKIAENLIKKIDDAVSSANTENTEKIKDVTPSNVKIDDKSDLEKAKDDLEKVLEDYNDNLTDNEKNKIKSEIENIEKTLEVIEKVETVEDMINALPDEIKSGDTDIVNEVIKAYNALTKYEQSILDKDAKEKIDKAKFEIEKLNNSEYSEISPKTGYDMNMILCFMFIFMAGSVLFVVFRRIAKKL